MNNKEASAPPKIIISAKNSNSNQPVLPHVFHASNQIEFDGIEMGILDNGQPYLSQRGLARFCDIDAKTLSDLSADWKNEKTKPRGQKILSLLIKNGYEEDSLFFPCEYKGTSTNVYVEPVCSALLEYYAFEAEPPKAIALDRYRLLGRKGFRDFVYEAVGYKPEENFFVQWRYFNDRVAINYAQVPTGYFSIFQESAGIFAALLNHGVTISDKMVTDISVGQTWGNYWTSEALDKKYKSRCKYEHNYPAYYRQASSNPQECFAYPIEALVDFRIWLQNNYLPSKFPKYILNQIEKGNLGNLEANQAVLAITGVSLIKQGS